MIPLEGLKSTIAIDWCQKTDTGTEDTAVFHIETLPHLEYITHVHFITFFFILDAASAAGYTRIQYFGRMLDEVPFRELN